MALNAIGLGLLFTAKDLASGVMKNVRSGFARTRDELGRFGKTARAALSNVKDNLNAVEDGANGGRDSLGRFVAGPKSGLEELTGKVKKLGGAIGGYLFAKSTLDAASEFEFQIAKIRTVIDETSLSTEAAREATMGLAATYGIDALQQADALYETISAGITDAAKATDLVGVANQFAVGGTTGLAGAIDVLTSAVNTYADQGLTAARASDLMFTAIAAGKTTAEQLSQSLGEIAPTAHAAGVGFDELQAAIAALTVQGIKTPQAVTSLNAMLSNIMKPSSDAANEARRLGIEFNATALKTMGLKGVLGQLIGNAKVNNDTFTQLFGSVEGVKGALALTASDGAKLNEILDQMKGASRATKKAFDIMANTGKFQETRFEALRKNAMILLAEGFQPLQVEVLKLANAVLEWFGKMPKPVREFGIQATVALVAVKALAIYLGGPVVAAMLLAVAAVALFKRAIDRDADGIGRTFHAAVGGVKLAFEALMQLFSQGGFSGRVREEFLKGGNAFVNFAVRAWLVVNRVKNFLGALADGFLEVVDAAGPSFDALGQAVSGLTDLFSDLWETVDPSSAASAFDAMGAAGGRVGKLLGVILRTLANVTTVVLDLGRGFLGALGPVWQLLVSVVDEFQSLFSEIGDIAAEVGLLNNAVDGSQGPWIALGQAIGNVVSFAADLLKSLVKTAGGVLRAAFSVIGGIVGLFTGSFEGGIKRILFGVISLITHVVIGLMDLLAKVSDWLLGTQLSQTVEGWRSAAEEFNKIGSNLKRPASSDVEDVAPAPVSPPIPNTPPSSATSPALASIGPPSASFDPGLVEAAAAKAAAAAVSKAPGLPPITMVVDGEVLGRVAAKAQGGNAAASFLPASVSEG